MHESDSKPMANPGFGREMRNAFHPFLGQDAYFRPRENVSQAQMCTTRERGIRSDVLLSIDVESIRVVVFPIVPAGNRQGAQDHVSLSKIDTKASAIPSHDAHRVRGSETAHGLIDEFRDGCGIVPQADLQRWILRKILIGKTENVGHRIHAAQKQEVTHGENLIFADGPTIDLRGQ